jgi:hypothetical protein
VQDSRTEQYFRRELGPEIELLQRFEELQRALELARAVVRLGLEELPGRAQRGIRKALREAREQARRSSRIVRGQPQEAQLMDGAVGARGFLVARERLQDLRALGRRRPLSHTRRHGAPVPAQTGEQPVVAPARDRQ